MSDETAESEEFHILGASETRRQAERQLDDGLRTSARWGPKARAYVASSGLALTIAGGLLANLTRLSDSTGWLVISCMILAMVLFALVSALGYLVDRPAAAAVGPDLPDLRGLVDRGVFPATTSNT